MEINQYAVTASEMKDLSFLDIDQYVSAGVYQSQKVPVSLVKAYMLSENIEQILFFPHQEDLQEQLEKYVYLEQKLILLEFVIFYFFRIQVVSFF